MHNVPDPPGIDPAASEALEKLRADYPTWSIELRDRMDVPWRARRQREPIWRGGVVDVEAATAEQLRERLERFLAIDAEIASRP
ncbi:hypothetical protein [Spirillospora albida]|uniref:hypothetical protein n=1 Tax=Spirillospora albida TaxID=58123 RepID=UPI0004BF5E13|nr:hypothetical protein [Spirillospora albida]